jgi:2-polyprenyl-3-methyl-5-hydroxy-6-metoxy-1,4-benzoquinol methylase
VAKKLRVGEVLLAVEGLALSRQLFQGTNHDAAIRLVEIRDILLAMAQPDSIENQTVDTDELNVAEGYARWASTYDDAVSPIIDVEQPALIRALESFPKGTATDVCCGTGRVAELLHQLGHRVTGMDQSREMVEMATQKNPSIPYRVRALGLNGPAIAEEPQDLVTCALALAHFPDLVPPLRDIAMMLRPGGSAVITTPHPVFVTLDGQAFFNCDEGYSPWVRNHPHQFSDYLRAFQAAGLSMTSCEEVVPADGSGPMSSLAGLLRPEAARQAYLGVPVVVLWVLRKPALNGERSR